MATATRQRLLDAAVELLIDEGRSGITTGRLTAQAGVVQSGFYNHFASVDACIRAALDEVSRRVHTISEVVFEALRAPGYNTPGRVDAVLVEIFREAASQPTMFRLLVQRDHEPDVADTVEGVLAMMRAEMVATILQAGARTDSISQEEAEAASSMVVGVVLSSLEHVLDGADPLMVSRVSATFVTHGVLGMAGVDNVEETEERVDRLA